MNQKLFTKNFSLLIAGQAASLFGNNILHFALSMYVLELTGSATIFAGLLAVSMLPTILFSPLGGVLADRADRRKVMVGLDLISGFVILLSALLLTHGNDLTTIGITLVIMSVLEAFESPTVQACIPQMLSGDNIVRGNAIVNQVSAASTLIGPFAGSMLYTAFGIKPVMYAGTVCFLATAMFECFIRLSYTPAPTGQSVFATVRDDLAGSARYICKEKTSILKMLLLIAMIAFFIQGVSVIGLPYLVRTTLELNANYYGIVESVLGLAGLIGSIVAAVTKFHTADMNKLIIGLGLCLLPVGAVFILSSNALICYIVLLIFFSIIQITASIFSIFALSIIQRLSPENMIGKIMAFVSTITLCAQPISQILYGLAFDSFSGAVYLVIIPTGMILCVAGCFAQKFFRNLEQGYAPTT